MWRRSAATVSASTSCGSEVSGMSMEATLPYLSGNASHAPSSVPIQVAPPDRDEHRSGWGDGGWRCSQRHSAAHDGGTPLCGCRCLGAPCATGAALMAHWSTLTWSRGAVRHGRDTPAKVELDDAQLFLAT